MPTRPRRRPSDAANPPAAAPLQPVTPTRLSVPKERRRSGATAADSFGNKMKVKSFDQYADVFLPSHWNDAPSSKRLGYGPGTVTSDRPRCVYLVFARPVSKATSVDLDLDARHVGLTGSIRFRIAASEMKPW